MRFPKEFSAWSCVFPLNGNQAEIRREASSHDKTYVKLHTFEVEAIVCVFVVIDLLLRMPRDRAVTNVSMHGQQSTVQSG
jgi:hypothetical protein